MDNEKTLLQQIRDKEQEQSKKIDAVKAETDAEIAAARHRAEEVVNDAERSGKMAADEFLKKEKEKTDAEIERMKKATETAAESARIKGETNLQPTVEKIVHYVTMK
jgi:vacuolar-type H+-ATPase subunit H